MILFRCPSCGAAYRVEDTYAGGSADCQNCGAHIGIPRESDPEVVLVFHAGASEDGVPMTREGVARAFESGELRATDLVLDDGVWRPLALELRNMDNSSALGDKSSLSYALEIATPHGRTVLESLPYLPVRELKRKWRGASPSEGEEGPAPEKGKAKKVVFSVFAPPPDEEEDGRAGGPAGAKGTAAPGRKKPHIPRSVWIGGQVFLGLVALAAGYKFGVGPLISAMRGRPTVVFVAAPDANSYDVTLGWRHLHARIPRGNKVCALSLFVCPSGEHQSLRLRRTGGTSLKLTLFLRPGAVLLVNPKGRQTFAVIEPGKFVGRSVGNSYKHLVEQIAHNAPPLAARQIAETLHQWSEQVCTGTTQAPILSGREYAFDSSIVGMSGAVSEALGKLRVHPAKILIPREAPYSLRFKEGYLKTRIPAPEKSEAVLRLPAKKVILPAGLSPNIPKDMELHLDIQSENLVLAMRLDNQHVKSRKGMLTGSWSYQARYDPVNLWHWSWTYHGSCKFKVKTKRKGKPPKVEEKSLHICLRTIDDRPRPLFELE